MKLHERIKVNSNSSLHMFVYGKENIQYEACVIFSHGFSVAGFESRRMFLELADILVEKNFLTILFDYRGSGYSDLNFSEMTIDTEIEDLNSVIEHVKQNIYPNGKLFIWGMSFGSGVSALVSEKRNDIDGVILWCLSSDLYNRYKDRLGIEILKKGYTYTDKGFRVNKEFLDSLKDKDVFNSIKSIRKPILFVHGNADTTANVELSIKAFEIANEPKKLEIINGGVHGFKLQPEQYKQAIIKTMDWLRNSVRDIDA